MSQRSLRFGLLGCGKIAERHANLLGNNEVTGAKLTAVCDIDGPCARTFASSYGVDAYSSIDEMMKSGKVDIVSVLTPSGTHAANVIELATYGRPIVVEKPMALTLVDADRMIEACDLNGVKLFVSWRRRENGTFQDSRRTRCSCRGRWQHVRLSGPAPCCFGPISVRR